jgi:hypothetical protein
MDKGNVIEFSSRIFFSFFTSNPIQKQTFSSHFFSSNVYKHFNAKKHRKNLILTHFVATKIIFFRLSPSAIECLMKNDGRMCIRNPRVEHMRGSNIIVLYMQ